MRKIYLRLLPSAILSYLLAYIDRINASFAALTMRGDLDMIEGLKKSKRFSALTDALGARIDGVVRTGAAFQNFVVRNEQQLRQMADNSPGMRWMLPYIEDIVKRNSSTK